MAPAPTYAAAAERLRQNGYSPIPHRAEGVAVRTMSLTAPQLAALVARGDLALERRVLTVLSAHGLTGSRPDLCGAGRTARARGRCAC